MRTSHELLLSRLRFRHLQLITEIERSGSLSRAADALSLTQPALSKSLAELEATLGFAVFHRGPRGLQKTPQGAVLMRGAERLLRELQHVQSEAEAAAHDHRAAGILRLGAPAFLAVTSLPAVVRRLTQADPPLVVHLTEASVPRLMEDLQRGELDALVSVYNPAVMASAGGKSARFEPFAQERYVVIAPAKHPLAASRAITWRTLAKQPWVLTRAPSLARVFIEDSFRREGVEPPVPLCETDGPVTAARMVAAGVGLSSVPESTAREAKVGGAVTVLKLRTAQPKATLGLVYRDAMVGHPHVEALRAALQ